VRSFRLAEILPIVKTARFTAFMATSRDVLPGRFLRAVQIRDERDTCGLTAKALSSRQGHQDLTTRNVVPDSRTARSSIANFAIVESHGSLGLVSVLTSCCSADGRPHRHALPTYLLAAGASERRLSCGSTTIVSNRFPTAGPHPRVTDSFSRQSPD